MSLPTPSTPLDQQDPNFQPPANAHPGRATRTNTQPVKRVLAVGTAREALPYSTKPLNTPDVSTVSSMERGSEGEHARLGEHSRFEFSAPSGFAALRLARKAALKIAKVGFPATGSPKARRCGHASLPRESRRPARARARRRVRLHARDGTCRRRDPRNRLEPRVRRRAWCLQVGTRGTGDRPRLPRDARRLPAHAKRPGRHVPATRVATGALPRPCDEAGRAGRVPDSGARRRRALRRGVAA
jgi:hypothetical protein